MREICQIEIGQWGIQIGQQFWTKAIKEHSIDEDGKFVGDSDKSTQYAMAGVNWRRLIFLNVIHISELP